MAENPNRREQNRQQSARQIWSAVGSMSLCVALLIASEFMPVSLLTTIVHDLHATEGMAGHAISISRKIKNSDGEG